MNTFRINESNYNAINTFVTANLPLESESKVQIMYINNIRIVLIFHCKSTKYLK